MRIRVIDRRAVKHAAPAEASAVQATSPPPNSVEQRAAERVREEDELRAQRQRALEDAQQEAARIVSEARVEAGRLLRDARAEAESLTAAAAREGEASAKAAAERAEAAEHAKFAGAWIALHAREARSLSMQTDRIARLAGIVAERLLGQALDLDPSLIVLVARRAVEEIRDLHAVRIEAHPADVDSLRHALSGAGASEGVVLVSSSSCERASFRLSTDLGAVHAPLKPRIDRLTSALRDALHTLS